MGVRFLGGMGLGEILYGGLVDILHRHSVVGGDTYFMYKNAHAVRSGDQFFYPSNRNLRFRREMR